MLKQLVGTSPTLEKAFAGEKLSLKDGLTLFEENEHVLGAAAEVPTSCFNMRCAK